jgi:hypothetical protein
MDSQSALWSAAGLAALVHGLARAEAQDHRDSWTSREVLMEASFAAARTACARACRWTASCTRWRRWPERHSSARVRTPRSSARATR